MGKLLIVADPASELPATLELVAAAHSLSNDSDIVAAIAGTTGVAAGDLPVSAVYVAEDERLGEPDSASFDAATDVLTAMVREIAPDVILCSRSDYTTVTAPRIAARLGSAFARDCTAVAHSDDGFMVTRPVYGGNADATYSLHGSAPPVIMIRPGSYDPAAADGTPELKSFDPAPHIRDTRSTLLRTVQEAREGVRLEDAEVVVSGGRGLGGPEPFAQLAELADLLGGAVGASRAACDAGWIDYSHQVGLTGKTVSPKLYLSFGISGASQHMAGCSSSRAIVAVNTDPDASIFKDARFGVVGDWSKVLPALVSALRDVS